MPVRATVLTLAAVACVAAAYRFASHGIEGKDNLCIGLACAAVAVAGLLLWLAFRRRPRQRE